MASRLADPPTCRLDDPVAPIAAHSLSLVRWLFASWVVLLVVGYVSLRTPTALGARNFVSYDRAIFTTVNVATQTGFAESFAKPESFAVPVQWIFALQTLSGALLSVVGGGVLLARVLKLPHSDGRIAATGLILLCIGMGLGLLTWHDHESLQRAAFRGLGAISCSGLTFGQVPDAGSCAFTLLLGPLSIVGSFGVVAALEIIDAVRRRRRLNEHVRRTIELAGTTYCIGGIVIAALLGLEGASFRSAVARASGLVLAARGYGLPFEFAEQWPRDVVWAVIAVIVIGTGTAGAVGSMGVGWLVTMPEVAWRRLLKILAWQTGILLAALMFVLQSDPQLPADRLVLLIASAGMNVGLSHEAVSMTGPGLVVLAVVMLVGKLIPLVFLQGFLSCHHNP